MQGELVFPSESDIKVVKSDLFGTQFTYGGTQYSITMPGAHQLKNMTCVIEVCEFLKVDFNITEDHIQKGIAKTILPARVEVLSTSPLVVLDGGHNADGAKAFYDAVEEEISKKDRVIVIAGMMADKEVETSLMPLMKKTDVFLAVTPQNPRAMKATELSAIAEKYSEEALAVDDVKEAVSKAFSMLDSDSALLCVGSLYLAGEVREYLIEYSRKFN
jgi:dihydrofolate synthase/folylpolyglutamate synthase